MSSFPTTTIRIDPETKLRAAEVFEEIGLTTSAAINAFLKAVVREGGMPFDLRLTESNSSNQLGNQALNQAGTSRKDEFYTLYEDVAAELKLYKEQFRGKKVICNCDDPIESAFVKFFVIHFNEFGLKQLIATSYSGSELTQRNTKPGEETRAQKAVITFVPDRNFANPEGSIDWNLLFNLEGNSITQLDGNGDFRSPESEALLKDSDVVVTNPPFSLFRQYLGQIIEHDKLFLILGNMNATTYKEVFPLIRDDKVWYGESIRSGDRKFFVPESYPLDASNCGVDEIGRRFIRVKGVRWFTNIDNGKRHKMLELTSVFEEHKFSKYENYDAIEISKTSDIPNDYQGVMGVPITFLDKYCSDQFEIIMLANGNARTNESKEKLRSVGYRAHALDKGGVGIINGQRVYVRVLIRKKTL